jgi:hypothetical protein
LSLRPPPSRRRHRLRGSITPGNKAGLAAGAVTFALVATCAAAAWPAESPLEPGLAGRHAGSVRWAWLYLAAGAAAFLAYVAGLVALRRRVAALAAVAVVGAAVQLAPLAAPLLLSSDAWTYWDYGRIAAVHGGNPYSDTPADFSADPAFPYVGADWRDTTSVYGPAFTLASEPVALASGASADAAAWLFKGLAAIAMLACAALAASLARRRPLAFAFVAWNPLLALHAAGGGHNDAWVGALVLGALVAGATGRRQLAGAAWVVAILVKWTPAVFLVLRTVEARSTRRRVGHAGFAVTAIALGGIATWRYGWKWLGAFGPLARNANEETRFAIPHRLETLGVPDAVALALVLAALAVAYAWLLREAVRGRARLALAGGLLLLATPYLAPWYLAWVVPLAAAEEDSAGRLLALGLSAYLIPQAVPV